ncbi:MAG TPA: tetratricopeptide repeat protein [Prolixibacteraceae bacterium]|nr:tetratricopeptide repeat protein [Prolixibacteraceae bacterium]
MQSQEKIDVLILNRKYNEALSQIEKKLQKNPAAELFLKKGMVLNNLQQYQDAVSVYSTGLQHDPENLDLNTELAENLSLLGNYHDAVRYYQKAVQLDPHDLSVKAKLGRTHINLKNMEKAYDIFAEIYALDSTNVYWNKQFAFCSFKIGRKKQAIVLYENVIERNPRDYKTYFNLACLYSNKEQKKAVELFEKGLEQFPDDTEMLLDFANLYFGGKQYESAVPKYESYFSAGGDSTDYKALLNYGTCCYLSGNEEKALEVLTKCYHVNPNDAILLFYMSLCNKKMNRYEKAESFMEGAIKMSYPDWLPEMHHHLGQIYGQQRKFKESVEALKKAHEFDPSNPEVLFEIATTYEEYNSNKTLALNYYRIYLLEAGESGKNINYALTRIERIKEDLFFEE